MPVNSTRPVPGREGFCSRKVAAAATLTMAAIIGLLYVYHQVGMPMGSSKFIHLQALTIYDTLNSRNKSRSPSIVPLYSEINRMNNNFKSETQNAVNKYDKQTDKTNNLSPTRPMLRWVPNGGFGNQIFQYGFVYCASQKTNRTPTIESGNQLLTVFSNITAVRVSKLKRSDLPGGRAVGIEQLKYLPKKFEEIQKYNDTWVGSYFLSWKYFHDCESDFRLQLRIKQKLLRTADEYLHRVAAIFASTNKISTDDITFIGTHVRRGDRASESMVKRGRGSAPLSYINNSMNYYNKQFKYPLFVVVSDGIQWCKNNIKSHKNNVVFSSLRSYQEDFTLLTLCNHSIITVGTFGWFAAWLTAGEVVYYGNFPPVSMAVYPDFYPPSWRFMI